MEHTFFRREIDNKSTVVDLGMNDGRFAREMHEKFGCKVIGVEANPHWACKLTNSDSITCHNLAISASTGNVKFLIADDDEASHIISNNAAAMDPAVTEVRSASLGTFLEENCVTEVDLLKVDIEGAELQMFEGPDFDVLTKAKQLSVEFHAFFDPSQRPRVKKIVARMKHRGFYCIDFSATWKDVLFINQSAVKLSPLDRLMLIYRKYALGVPALIRKAHKEGLRSTIRKIIARRFSH